MMTFTQPLPRDTAKQFGHEARAIGEQGTYSTPTGRTMDLKESIARAVAGTQEYRPEQPFVDHAHGTHTAHIEVTNETTLSAARRLLEQKLNPVALNFASATNPGGGFLNGARAQEEYLARSSCLYECLRHSPIYAYHRQQNDPLYTDYMLYSPGVPMIRGDDGGLLEAPYTVSVITAAAVHANHLPAARQSEITPAMWQRILKVLAIGLEHAHESIVLGAWGCGAFGNDGHQIAGLFKKALSENFKGAYRSVIFAILDWSPERRFIGPFQTSLGN